MKKTLLITLLLSISSLSFASSYVGFDNEGNECRIKLILKEDGTTAVSVKTQKILPQLFGASSTVHKNRLKVSNTFVQGNESETLYTTDKVIVKFEGDQPFQFDVTRKTKLKKGWLKNSKNEKSEVNCKLI